MDTDIHVWLFFRWLYDKSPYPAVYAVNLYKGTTTQFGTESSPYVPKPLVHRKTVSGTGREYTKPRSEKLARIMKSRKLNSMK